jgi:hypothetical protein
MKRCNTMNDKTRNSKLFSAAGGFKRYARLAVFASLFIVMMLFNVALAMAQVQSHMLSETRTIDASLDMYQKNITNVTRLGVGTTNPSQALHVVGNSTVTGSTSLFGGLTSNALGPVGLSVGDGTQNFSVVVNSSFIGVWADILSMYPGSNPAPAAIGGRVINSTGGQFINFQIGTYANPQGWAGFWAKYTNTTGGVNSEVALATKDYAGDFKGSVNITNSTSNANLCLNGDCRSSWPAGGGGTITGGGSAGNLSRWTGATTLGNSSIYEDATNRYIGIGTSSPSQRLHVAGNTTVTGAIFAMGGPTTLSGFDLSLSLGNGTNAVGGFVNASTYGMFVLVNRSNDGFAIKGQTTDNAVEGSLAINKSSTHGWMGVEGENGGMNARLGFLANGSYGAYGQYDNLGNYGYLGGNGIGVYGIGSTHAGYFAGNVTVTQNLSIGSNICLGGTCRSGWPTGTINGDGSAGNLSVWTSGTTLGNSTVYDSGGSIGIKTSSPQSTLHVQGGIIGNVSGSGRVPGNTGVFGSSNLYGVVGDGATTGVVGNASGSGGIPAASVGVYGTASWTGVVGNVSGAGSLVSNTGVFGTGSSYGVYGKYSDNVYGYVGGSAFGGEGVYGQMNSSVKGYLGAAGAGVAGESNCPGGSPTSGSGVDGCGINVGVVGRGGTLAGYFIGNVNVTGTLYASNVSSNSPLQLQTQGTTRMYINDSTGGVGIGTSSPVGGLHVFYMPQGIMLEGESSNELNFTLKDNNAGHDYSWYSNSAGIEYLGLMIDGSDRVVFGANGRVGIGTATPDQTLKVAGNANITGNMSADKVLIGTNTAEYGYTLLANASDYRVAKLSTPYVGDSEPLDIYTPRSNAGTKSYINWQSDDSAAQQTRFAAIGALFNNKVNGAENGSLLFLTSAAGSLTEKMRINYDGKVGIGTTGPLSTLSVGGAGISGAGVYGNGSTYGGYFANGDAASGTDYAVYGTVTGAGTANYGGYFTTGGSANTNIGVFANSSGESGIYAAGNYGVYAQANSGEYPVFAQTDADTYAYIGTSWNAVYGQFNNTVSGYIGGSTYAVRGDFNNEIGYLAGSGNGVYGASSTDTGAGVRGEGNVALAYGVLGFGGSAVYGIYGTGGNTSGGGGIWGVGNNSNNGLLGMQNSTHDFGVYGNATGSSGTTNIGVYGTASGDTNNYAVYGERNSSIYGYIGGDDRAGYFFNSKTASYPNPVYGVYVNNTGISSGGGDHQRYGLYVYTNDTASSSNVYGVYSVADSAGGSSRAFYGYGESYDFYAAGPGTDYGTSSSIRWKRNIVEIPDALDKILEIRGVYFDWDAEHGGHHDMGFIAEEVGKYVPEVVQYEADGVYATGMDYGAMTPVLVEAIKEQQSQIESMRAENAALKSLVCLDHPDADICKN